MVWAEDEEQVDKLLGLGDRIPSVRHIVYSDPRGMRKYRDGRLMSAAAVAARGAERAAREPDLYNRLVDATEGDAVAVLYHLRHDGASEARDAVGRALVAPLRGIAFDPGPDDEYVGAAAAMDHGTGLCARDGLAVPDEGELRRRARYDDARFS